MKANKFQSRYPKIIGQSKEINQVLSLIDKIAPYDSSVLILGESGTGKELVAEAVHEHSQRKGKPYIRVNTAALPEELLLSELFGHEKGSFTGAVQRKIGKFELAQGGTIFLDEIGDISQKTQVALLRVLQEREFERVGGIQPIKVDVRVICATNRDLDEMVKVGKFRLDLYYRIRGITMTLPPLRERKDDIPILANHFIRLLSEKHDRERILAEDAIGMLCEYPWPGNVRELENIIRTAYFFAEEKWVTAKDLSTYTEIKSKAPHIETERTEEEEAVDSGKVITLVHKSQSRDLAEAKRELELEYITWALEQTAGNISKAAELLGMKRPRLSQKIKELGLKIDKETA
jgi:transcriptional regulator with PAS, ATPase and Fis domain